MLKRAKTEVVLLNGRTLILFRHRLPRHSQTLCRVHARPSGSSSQLLRVPLYAFYHRGTAVDVEESHFGFSLHQRQGNTFTLFCLHSRFDSYFISSGLFQGALRVVLQLLNLYLSSTTGFKAHWSSQRHTRSLFSIVLGL